MFSIVATHGSLTKAGKVRGQTPKIEGRKIVGTSSSLRNKSNFKKRFVLGRYPGQNKPGQEERDDSQFLLKFYHSMLIYLNRFCQIYGCSY